MLRLWWLDPFRYPPPGGARLLLPVLLCGIGRIFHHLARRAWRGYYELRSSVEFARSGVTAVV